MNTTCLQRAAFLFCATAIIQGTAAGEDIAARAQITFRGSSTLHDFEGVVASRPFTADFDWDNQTSMLHISAKTSLDVGKMTTQNRKRDTNMFKMFDLEHFAKIEGELEDAVVPQEGSGKARLHLKIRNIEHDVQATLSNIERVEDRISCTMNFPVQLSAFKLKAPSVMGIIRVDDTVFVECTITGRVDEQIAGR